MDTVSMWKRFAAALGVAVVLAGTLAFSGVATAASPAQPQSHAVALVQGQDEAQAEQARFIAWCQECLNYALSSDSVMLHQLFAAPETYGIDSGEPTLPTIPTFDQQQKDLADLREFSGELARINRSLLTPEQQLVYDIAAWSLDYHIEGYAFPLFEQLLEPSSATYAAYVFLLGDYVFTCEKDIEDYLVLLQNLPGVFESLADFGLLQVEAGLGLTDDALDEAVRQCELLAEASESNPFVDSFDRRIDEAPFLDEGARTAYKSRNAALFEEVVAPAYTDLADALRSFRGMGGRGGGLATVEGGRDYYIHLARGVTGSDLSVDEIRALCEEYWASASEEYWSLVDAYPGAEDEVYRADLYDPSRVDELLRTFEEAIRADFPYLSDRTFTVRKVSPSLEPYANPGTYLIRPFDDATRNVIFLNEALMTADYSGLATCAHEGFPGHLYQANYFAENGAYPAYRAPYDFLGYSEGWAVYAELAAFDYVDGEAHIARLRQLGMGLSYDMACLVDIAVNYDGMTFDEVVEYMNGFMGGVDAEYARFYYDRAVTSPTAYFPYWIGCLEIQGLRDAAEEALGADFDLVAFHEFLLTTGPAPFSVIREQQDLWIAEQMTVAQAA